MWATKVNEDFDVNFDQKSPGSPAGGGFHRSVSDGYPELMNKRKNSQTLEPLMEAGSGTFESTSGKQFATIRRSMSGSKFVDPDTPASPALGPSGEPKPAPKLSVFLGNRCTTVHFVRHAEGHHNVVTHKAAAAAKPGLLAKAEEVKQAALAEGKTPEEAEAAGKAAYTKAMRVEENVPVHFATEGADNFTDAELTMAGRNQCYALRGKMDRNETVDPLSRVHIDLVVVSPLKRCLETADIVFGPGKSASRPDLMPFVVHDMCRERFGEFYCDKRSSMSETRKDPRFANWDWETQKQDWPEDIMPFTDEDTAWAPAREPEKHVYDRAMAFLMWLAKRPEREVAVVSHSSFMKNMFKIFGGDTSKDDQDVLRAVPANCELRTVVLCHHGENKIKA